MKSYIRLLIFLVLALLSWWFQNFLQETPDITQQKEAHFPDYFMENFTTTSMDKQGQAVYILSAKRAEHFADDDSSVIYEPHILFKDINGDWSISAQKAHISTEKNIIHLYQNVTIIRSATSSRAPLNINTEYLNINTDSKIAETDELAHLKTQNFELDTRGMVFDNRQGILKLKSNVKGTYETPR